METELGGEKIGLASGLIPCGGRAPGTDDYDDDDEPPAARRTDASVEPVFFHSASSLLWGEILYNFTVGAVIDLTAGDGAVAMASLRAGCPYVGVALTDTHATELRKRVHNTAGGGTGRRQPMGLKAPMAAETPGPMGNQSNQRCQGDQLENPSLPPSHTSFTCVSGPAQTLPP